MKSNKTNFTLQLASKSPRRRELLEQIGVSYCVVDVQVDEKRLVRESPEEYVIRLACDKAEAGFNKYPSIATLGADTIVIADSHVLEKPSGYQDFASMMNRLSGSSHEVYTAVCLRHSLGVEHIISKTRVYFRPIDENEIERYWATGEPCDKAGGYGIQGYDALFVARIEGSYSGVVGLPLYETDRLLRAHQIPIWQY